MGKVGACPVHVLGERAGGRGGPKGAVRDPRAHPRRPLVPRALQRLARGLNSKDERVAQTAAVQVLEWAWGKPTTPLEDVTERQVNLI
jgi:hypothetical protein